MINQHDLKELFESARLEAQKSPDSQTKVGCLLVYIEDGKCVTLSKGHNRFHRNAPKNLPTVRPEKHLYIFHAEQVSILEAAKKGVDISKCVAIVTLSPCITCCRFLYEMGISTIYFEDEYHSFQHQLSTKDINFKLTKIGKYTKIELKI